jgi:chemotaxis response regulator CheB
MAFQILIVDDNPAIRKSIRAFIERNTDWRVCGEAENGQIAIEKG